MTDRPPSVESGYRYAAIPEWVLYHQDLSHLCVRLFGALARHGTDPKNCYPSHERLAKLVGCEIRSVQRPLRQLAEVGAIEIEQRSENGRQTSNGYRLAGESPLISTRAAERGHADTRTTGRAPERGSGRAVTRDEGKQEERKQEERSHASIDLELPDPVANAPLRDSLFQTEPQKPTPTAAEIFWQEQTGAAWEEFWHAYPRHKAAEASRVQFFKTARGVDVRVLIREAKVYADLVRSENRIAKYVCSAENWLLKKRWLDPRDETPEELLARQLAEMEPSNRNGHDVH